MSELNETLGKNGHAPTKDELEQSTSDKAPKKKRTCLKCGMIALGLFVAVLLIAYIVIMNSLDDIAVKMIQSVGSDIAGTPVTVESVDIDLVGTGRVYGLAVASPAGFANGTLLSIEEAGATVDVASLRSKTPVVNSLDATGVTAAVEANEFDCNLGLVIENVKNYANTKSDSSGKGKLPADIHKCSLHDATLILAESGARKRSASVHVEELTGNVMGGQFTITGVTATNPGGFDAKHAKTIKRAEIKLDPATYLTVPVVAESVTAESVHTTAEVGPAGSNLGVMMQIVRRISETLGAGDIDDPAPALPVDVRSLKATDTRTTLQRTGNKAQRFDVDIADMSGSISEGMIDLKTISIKSPPGFDCSEALAIPGAHVSFDPATILAAAPRIRSVKADSVTVCAETGPAGNNIGIITTLAEDLLASLGGAKKSSGAAITIETCSTGPVDLHLKSTGQGKDAKRLHATIESVTGAPSQGKLTITNATVGNPPGYTADKAFTLGTIEMTFRFESLFTDTIVIDEVIVTDIDAIYETSVRGSNFTGIERELKAFEQSMGKGKSEKGFIIKNLYLKNIKGQLSPSLLRNVGVRPPARLEDMHLKNLKSDSGTAMLSIIVQQVRPGFDNVGEGLLKGIGAIGEGAGTAVKEVGKGVGKGVGTVFKGIFGGDKNEEAEPAPAE